MQKTSSPSKFPFINKVIDKQQLTELIIWAFSVYGIARAAQMADNLKELGFFYATKAGLSLSIEDLHIPRAKRQLLNDTIASLHNTDEQYLRAQITIVERFQKVIDTWHNMNEVLREEIIKYFQEEDPLNSLYMMSMSGARGNMSQVRQLVGMRGLMSDPNGQIIDLPIISNFREGLTVTEYFISSYGARKGLVDTALRTADSGYLTRRLVDVAQHVIVRETNCCTKRGIIIEQLLNNQKVLIPLEQALLGRTIAENIYHPKTGELIIKADKCISAKYAHIITASGTTKVLVRSPLTCESDNGVCQYCYGWNLAHRKLVDTGEAVGVIAAQSIGEPGTQLTMRTFHTGGVFTGEVAQTIRSPIQGILKYSQNVKLTNIRTKYGELAYFVEQESIIFIKSIRNNNIRLTLPIGTTLLVHHNSKVSTNQVVALSPVSQQFVTEEAEKRVFADLSGKVVFTNLILQETNNSQTTARSIMKEGLIWIISGHVYDIPSTSNTTVKILEEIKENTPLAQQKITNQCPGYVRILESKNKSSKESYEIQIVTAELVLQDGQVSLSNQNFPGVPILETSNCEKFILQVTPGEKLLNAQTIAYLVSDMYKTTTGGIIKYLDLSITNKRSKILKNAYEVLGSGYILWISEETHEVNKDQSLLLVQHGDIIEVGTELIKNVFARIAGIVEIVIKDGAVREIIIKPGKLYASNIQDICLIQKRKRGFLRPGETVNGEFYADKLIYWEYIQKKDKFFILIRPVTVYSIPYKSYSFESDQKNTNLLTQVINTTKFRDGERIKSIFGVDLIKSYIVIHINESYKNLYTTIEYLPSTINGNKYQLKLITLETLLIKDYYFHSKSQTAQILVKDQQKIAANTVVAKIETLSATAGKVENICKTNNSHYRILVSSKDNEYTFMIPKNEPIFVKLFQWIYSGNYISTQVKSPYSGQITKIQDNILTLRIARPYLVSSAADLYVNNNNLVLQGESIAVIKFYRPKTKDIVQGLPKIEEILEARKKSDAFFKPHDMLTNTFNQYVNAGIDISDAAKLALHEIQIHLVKQIQLVYQSQKVDIADKHIEIIVKQMTSKVEIQAGGNTKYLPTELVDINKIEIINKTLIKLKQKIALYSPVLLGITKASLNTESFISAASFQETTKVLTEAALSGRLDWLKGLKENVIIGRLIPAGTGFDMYNYNEKKQDNLNKNKNQGFIHSIDADDIILDDRVKHSIED